jgi:cell division septum initiation protein DivIVA
MPQKISKVQVAQLHKLASSTIRALSEENVSLKEKNAELKEKVASFEKRARAEKIASSMEEKGINPDTSFEHKVDELLARDNLDVLEEAVGLAAPQMKIASIHDDGVEVEHSGDDNVDRATQQFANSLASLD